ncbi:PREDICTED: coiled-coil domain-containing protein 186-like [Diuraphis noxia]|uniref:coiled-coil domain-containing protein 186-like n=1 Tax=Diuraphis noxia TaxID=143948 RepID=UPI0007637DE8|nr:PREDICTED: coiled-coil domain-containing protein 186-like [Diuraphis noxia]
MEIPDIANDYSAPQTVNHSDPVDSNQLVDDDEEENDSCSPTIDNPNLLEEYQLKTTIEDQLKIINKDQKEIPVEYQLKELSDVVRQQQDELDYYQRQLAINEHKYLTDVSDLQSQLQSSKKMYDTAKHEKEAAFMRYVLKEKEILDLTNEKKKLMDSLKDRDKQITRLKANSKDVASCTGVIEAKNREIKEYKTIIDLLKDEKSKISKDLEIWKTKYEHESKCSHETESKLLHEIQELQNRLESLTKQNESFNQESNLEKIILSSKLYLDLKECSEHQLQEMNKLKSVNEELNLKLTKCTCTVNSLEDENIDLKTYMESCEIKTNELLVFTESLSSRNALLQSECLNLQTDLDRLKSNCDILKQKNNDLKIAFRAQEDSIAKEKELYDRDKKELASHLAHKMQMIADLKTTLERTQDDLHVSKRKFKTTVAELTKELQKKNIVDTSVEMKMVLDKMVKLQQENARICEKLDFVEDHNKHLLCELKKNSSIMQKHKIPGIKNVSSLSEQKPERY